MSAFVKKLVEKASFKKPVGFSDNIKPDDVNPRLVFHYGIPSGSMLLAYDSIQQILAIATKDGRIKLFGKSGSQALLESSETVPSKFLLFIENQGVLLNVNVNNHVEVWDVDRKCLSYVHNFEKEITSFAAMQHVPYLYAGDSAGTISVLRLDQEKWNIEQMKYHIPLSASHGKTHEVDCEIAVNCILPQPAAESKRALIIYTDGVITLWAIQESKVIFTTGGTTLQSLSHETKKVTAACWACPIGSKVVVGYSNGDIFIWSVPCTLNSKTEQAFQNECCSGQSAPVCKLNLGYRADKIPISKLKWADIDGKSSRLYVVGSSDHLSTNLLQVVLLNEQTESRTLKLGLHPPELCVDMEIISGSIEQNKNKYNSLLLLGKSGHAYTYDDSLIERYLIQCQTKSLPSIPKEVTVKLPFSDSRITVSKLITNNPCMPYSGDEDFDLLEKNSLPLFPFERRHRDGSISNSTNFSSFSKARNLYITGHGNGAINFWDASCPLLLPVASLTQQSDNDFSLTGVPLTALYHAYDSRILISGDQSGMVRIYEFKSESFAPQSSFLSLQGSSKKGNNNIIRSIKLVKVNGAVLSINTTQNLKQLVVGCDQGYVSLIDPEGPTVLYQRHIPSELSTGIISTHFETCNLHGFEKNVLVVATKDSSVLALESGTGNTLSSNVVRPKIPSRALFIQILGGQGVSGRGSTVSDGVGINNVNSDDAVVLLCAEKAVYVYSLLHIVEGTKKVHYKKKFHSSSCCWASTFSTPSDGLILLFSDGKIQIRSLPELSLLKETSLNGLSLSTSKASSFPDNSVSSSHDGELIIVNGDQEMFFVSIFLRMEAYRLLDPASQVFNKDLVNAQGLASFPSVKEKKKGIFSSVIKDNKGTKSKNGLELEAEDSRRSVEEVSMIFSSANFPTGVETETKLIRNDEDDNLDIDDIDIEDPKEKPKGHPMIAALNKQNITNKFQAIKGKLKHVKMKNDKTPANEEPQEEKAGAVDQIKKRYGYVSSSESSAANMAKTKLSENLKKLQGINLKTTEMQDTARSFSSMAKEVLKFAETDKKGS
ncbi:Transducin/WD40 repeat-like superfamily protein [Forsythia ovata]|uniref:Transducin/WD40 repeat-like superfamily protein n=1 Tax=Forsythia ovata TaxID=205694 RepID=A0ABD1UBU9_9LAMI